MNIALDFDGTYTEDPALWDLFIAQALANDHIIRVVTMRYEHEANRPMKDLAKIIPVIFTGRKSKKSFLEDLGITIDVWIDDNPHWILIDAEA